MTVRFFAAGVDVVGASTLELPATLRTVGEVRAWLTGHFPLAAALWRKCLIAVDQGYASEDQVLNAGQEVAIIPPVSGG